MGRRRCISEHILNILTGGNTLCFTEIKTKLEERLGRKVTNRGLAENLAYLMNQKLIEKVVDNGRLKYRLTKDLYRMRIKASLHNLIDSNPLAFYAFYDAENSPYVILTNTKDEYTPNSGNPEDIFAQRMFDELEKYPKDVKDKVRSLVVWAYWTGVQETKKIWETDGLLELAEKNCVSEMEHYKKLYEETGDSKINRVFKACEALFEIIGLTKELVAKDNLKEFFDFANENLTRVKMLKVKVWEQHIGLAGEGFFENLMNYHEMVLRGLSEANVLPNDETLFMHGEAWNGFFSFFYPVSIGGDIGFDDFDFSNVKGDLNHGLKMIQLYKDAVKILCELPYKSRALVVHLWGFPEVTMLAKESVIESFQEWLNALKGGWLYPSDVKRARELFKKAYKAVARGREPSGEFVCISTFPPFSWRDVYLYHPRGKQRSFWDEISSLLSSYKHISERNHT